MDKFRPDLTEYVPQINAMKERFNSDPSFRKKNSTDICRIALERLFAVMFPGEPIPIKREEIKHDKTSR